MSGIIGIFNLDGRPADLSELKRLAAPSRHRAVDGEDFWIGPSIGIGHQHFRVTPESLTERQPLVSPTGIAVALDGRLDNRQEIIDECSAGCGPPDDVCSDAALVIAAYERFAERFAVHLNGDFALAVFDSAHQRLMLARDRMGARALYYCALPRTLVFASEIKCLLAHPSVTAHPDEDALADLVIGSYSDGHRTCFQNVHTICPGHLLMVTTDGIVLQRHWDFDPGRESRYRSFEEYADCFQALFENAVRRRLRSAHPVAVAVSGGLDSSAVFCQAAALSRRGGAGVGLHGLALTFPRDVPANEVTFLDQVETASHLPITRLPVSAFRFLPDAEKLTWQMEAPGVAWDAQLKLFAHARRMGCAVILDGYFGDQMLFERGYLVDLVRRGQWLKVRRDLREFAAWMTDVEAGVFERLLGNALVRSVPPRWLFHSVKKRTACWRARRAHPRWYTRTFLERALDRALSRPDPGRSFPSMHAEQYYRQVTSGFYRVQLQRAHAVCLMQGIEVAHPFRDRDLVAFLMAIPGEVVNWRGVPKALLREALSETLPDAIRYRRSKANFTAVTNYSIVSEFPDIMRLLTRDCYAVRAGFVDGDRVERGLATLKTEVARAETGVPGWQVTDLIGLEVWVRRFFGAALS
jgi:asparagine synthase (glutamine-hydrolysing)